MPAAESALLLFLQLKGGDPAAGEERHPVSARDLRDLLAQARDGLARLVAHFDDPATPYVPVPRPEIAPAFSDYEHLARHRRMVGHGGRCRERGRAPPTPAQRRAADPRASVWVTANAGTGKTRVLSDRVLRLLLDGANPEGILCLTFTKAAAAEMTGRIEERLAAWATRPTTRGWRRSCWTLTGEPADQERLDRARRLFAQVLELPRGLGIMTIHALCGALLRRFPLEAGVAPHFETIDERTAAELMQEARAADPARRRDPGTPLGRALQILAVTLTENTLSRDAGGAAGPAHAAAALPRRRSRATSMRMLGRHLPRTRASSPGWSRRRWRRRPAPTAQHDAAGLLAAAGALAQRLGQGCRARPAIAAWLAAPRTTGRDCSREYRRCFLTADGSALKTLATKKVASDAVLRALVQEQARLVRSSRQPARPDDRAPDRGAAARRRSPPSTPTRS